MKSQDILPVLLSILVIILVAIPEKQSKLIAPLTATMPLAAPLALWIAYSSNAGDRAVSQFSLGLVLGVIPTFTFLVTLCRRGGTRRLEAGTYDLNRLRSMGDRISPFICIEK